MIKKKLVLCVLFLVNSAFADNIECQLIGGIPSTFMVSKFSFTKTSDVSADFNMITTKGKLNFSNVECKDENIPDPVFSCEHDKFVMLLLTDEKPLKAVINPIVNSGKEYGPFFYLCKKLF